MRDRFDFIFSETKRLLRLGGDFNRVRKNVIDLDLRSRNFEDSIWLRECIETAKLLPQIGSVARCLPMLQAIVTKRPKQQKKEFEPDLDQDVIKEQKLVNALRTIQPMPKAVTAFLEFWDDQHDILNDSDRRQYIDLFKLYDALPEADFRPSIEKIGKWLTRALNYYRRQYAINVFYIELGDSPGVFNLMGAHVSPFPRNWKLTHDHEFWDEYTGSDVDHDHFAHQLPWPSWILAYTADSYATWFAFASFATHDFFSRFKLSEYFEVPKMAVVLGFEGRSTLLGTVTAEGWTLA